MMPSTQFVFGSRRSSSEAMPIRARQRDLKEDFAEQFGDKHPRLGELTNRRWQGLPGPRAKGAVD